MLLSWHHWYCLVAKCFLSMLTDWTWKSDGASSSIFYISVGTWRYAWFQIPNHLSGTSSGMGPWNSLSLIIFSQKTWEMYAISLLYTSNQFWMFYVIGDYLVLRPFQADLHQQHQWQLDSFLTRWKGSWISHLGRCFCLCILIRLLSHKLLVTLEFLKC